MSDAIAKVAGSAAFVAFHAVLFTVWITLNVGLVPSVPIFDPYPFSFLTLVVSLEAIFLSIFVLMSQNRAARLGDRRAHLDLQVDLLAERELTAMLHMLRALCAKEKVVLDDVGTDVKDLLRGDRRQRAGVEPRREAAAPEPTPSHVTPRPLPRSIAWACAARLER